MYKRIRIDNAKTRDEHRLVMEQYIGRKLKTEEVVHHLDGNGMNNDITNLKIMTRSEHVRHHLTGVKPKCIGSGARGRKGENSYTAKLTWSIVREIRSLQNKTIREIATIYGVAHSTISDIRNNKIWVE